MLDILKNIGFFLLMTMLMPFIFIYLVYLQKNKAEAVTAI